MVEGARFSTLHDHSLLNFSSIRLTAGMRLALPARLRTPVRLRFEDHGGRVTGAAQHRWFHGQPQPCAVHDSELAAYMVTIGGVRYALADEYPALPVG
jgi:hypothetical protein